MLGRKTYTQEELDRCRTAVDRQLTAYRNLAAAVASAKDTKAKAALEAFEPLFFDNMTVVLDRYFVHRLRAVTGKDTNPLNEVELLTESIIGNDAVLEASKVIKLVPDQSVLHLAAGDPISLSADDFERLATAFFDDLERKFV